MRVCWVNPENAAHSIEVAMHREEIEENPKIAQRKFGRFLVPGSSCNFGELCDLSAGGARIRSRKALPKELILHITAAGQDVFINARTIWKKKIGLLRHEYGVEFVDPTPEALQQIRTIAMTQCDS